MSSSSANVQLTMCQRYLKSCTHSITDEPICSLGKPFETTLVVSVCACVCVFKGKNVLEYRSANNAKPNIDAVTSWYTCFE